MRIAFCCLFLIITNLVLAQSTASFSGEFNNEPIEKVLLKLKDQFGVNFYYRLEWIDSITYTGAFSKNNLSEVLDKLLINNGLYFYKKNQSIYISQSAPINTTPLIIEDLLVKKGPPTHSGKDTTTNVYSGVFFAREYQQNYQFNNNDIQVIEIGQKSSFVSGESSILSGVITNSQTGEKISDALIYTGEGASTALSDDSGAYNITLDNGLNDIYIQYVGMKTMQKRLVIFSDGELNIELKVDVIALNEVVVEGQRRENIEEVNMGINKINIEDSKVMPVVLGESDVLKVATTFAGIQTVGEGAAGINVRGGKSDQNLFLLDGATVYNASHFLGFFSVFNSEALDDLEILKTGIPPKFGGRLASIFNISSKIASKNSFSLEGGISPITSRITTEIPIIKEKASLLLSGRTTYSNWVLDLVDNPEYSGNKVEFSDFIMSYDHDLSKKDNLSLSAYISEDNFRLNSDTLFSFSDFSYLNNVASMKWMHIFNTGFDGSLSGWYSRYNYEFETSNSPPNAFIQDFGINEVGIKTDFNLDTNSNHFLNFGLESKKYLINPGSKLPLGTKSVIAPVSLDKEQGYESALYLSDQHQFSDNLSFNYGIRYSVFSAVGPGDEFLYSEESPLNDNTIIDSISYSSGEVIKTYHGAEIRLSSRYLISESSSIKAGYSRNRQYIHSLTNTSSVSPTDVWRLSNGHIKPQISDELSLGYFKNFNNNNLETSIEIYVKRLQNLVDFKTGANFLLNNSIEKIALQGPGKAYGLELSLKKFGRLHGRFNYSYSRTFIKLNGNFPEEIINNGVFFPTNYDIPHTINLVSNFDFTKRFSLSYNFVYKSGRPITTPVGAYKIRGVEQVNYANRNASRIPDYLRMDIGITLKWGHRTEKLTKSFWTLSVYNLLGRDNPYSIYFDLVDGQIKGYTLTVFGSAIPTLTYSFKF